MCVKLYRVPRALLALLSAGLLAVTLSACNTIEGVGEDLGAAAKKIEKEANKNKTY